MLKGTQGAYLVPGVEHRYPVTFTKVCSVYITLSIVFKTSSGLCMGGEIIYLRQYKATHMFNAHSESALPFTEVTALMEMTKTGNCAIP